MREQLKKFINYDEGEKIRKALHERAKAEYQPKHKDQYIDFMNDNPCSFTVNHAQSQNHPYYFTLFTVQSQHVMGDCVEYRVMSDHWKRLIWNKREQFTHVRFQRGFQKPIQQMTFEVERIDAGECPIDGWNDQYYRIHFK